MKPLEKQDKSKNDSFCIMPWVHFHVAQNGNVIPCCQAPPHKVHRFGNINDQSISEIWNGEVIQAFRQKMLHGEKDVRCKQCYLKEEQGLKSLRQLTNQKYNEPSQTTKKVSPPKYFDIRFSNACNLKCRICGPWASSQWHKDAIELGMRKKDAKALTISIKNEKIFFTEIEPLLKNAQEFYFAGGEPLMMEQHYKVLDALLAANNTSCRLVYNTNFSQLSFKNWNVIDYWKQFSNIHVSASLDAEEERGELLRKNLSWNKVLENRKQLLKEANHIHFQVNPTICAFNVEHIPDFHRNWVNQNLIAIEDFIPNILINPKEYQVHVLPIEQQITIKEKYLNHLKWINEQSPKNKENLELMLKQFHSIIEQLGIYSDVDLFKKLNQTTNHLDSLRNEKTKDVFPELGLS